jgi:hypothetical protein
MGIEAAIKDLQDSMVVIGYIEKRHAERLLAHENWITEHGAEMQEYRRRIDQNLAEITDKLNGLIGYVAGHKPPPAQ